MKRTPEELATTAKQEQAKRLLEAVVNAKIAYWDRLRELELALAPNGEWSDNANNKVIAYIEMLAAGADEVAQIEEQHVTDVIAKSREA
ncbi:MAG: hypothetical protein ACXWVD_00110 [Telluria sp.]